MKTERKAVTLGGEKWITPNLMFEATFKNEDKRRRAHIRKRLYLPVGRGATTYLHSVG